MELCVSGIYRAFLRNDACRKTHRIFPWSPPSRAPITTLNVVFLWKALYIDMVWPSPSTLACTLCQWLFVSRTRPLWRYVRGCSDWWHDRPEWFRWVIGHASSTRYTCILWQGMCGPSHYAVLFWTIHLDLEAWPVMRYFTQSRRVSGCQMARFCCRQQSYLYLGPRKGRWLISFKLKQYTTCRFDDV